jgi:hypothetical protein
VLLPDGAPVDVQVEMRTKIPGSDDEPTRLYEKVVKSSAGHAFFVARPAGIRDVTVAIRVLPTPNWGLWYCDVTPIER